jgi:hypothetical protein
MLSIKKMNRKYIECLKNKQNNQSINFIDGFQKKIKKI